MIDHKVKKRFYYGYVVVIAGFVVWLVFGSNQSFGIFFKSFTDDFHWGRAETAFAYSLILLIQGCLAIPMGFLTDKLGPRFVIVVFGSFIGISYFLMSSMSNIGQFYLYYSIAAIGFSTAPAPVMATIARWFDKRRTIMTGIVQAGVGLGGFIFAPFSAWLIINYGWRNSFTVLAAISLVCIITAGLFLKRPGSPRQQLIRTTDIPVKKAPSGVGFSLREASGTGQFWIMVGIFFSFGFCRSTFLPHVALHTQDLGYTLSDGANVVAALTISSIFGRLWMNKISNKTAFMISFGITTVALTWGLITGQLWGLMLFGLVFGFGWGAQAVLRYTALSEIFGLSSIGLIMGVLGFVENVASAFGSYFGGYIFDTYGNYQLAFYLGIILSLAGVILVRSLRPVTHGAVAASRL